METKKYKNTEHYKSQELLEFIKAKYSLVLDSMADDKPKRTSFSTSYTKDRVKKLLENPSNEQNEKELRKVIDSLCHLSPQFQKLVDAIPNMCIFRASVIPLVGEKENQVEKIKKDYIKASQQLQKMNIQYEFQKIAKACCRYDTFYGYEIESNKEYFIKDLNPDLCKISSYDSCLNFKFDFEYFKGKEYLLESSYPPEFKSAYNKFLTDKSFRWQELDPNKTICIKYFNNNREYSFPPYASLFNDVYDLQDYKSLNKAKVESDIIKLLLFEIPLRKDSQGEDDFALSNQMITTYMQLLNAQLPDGISAVTTPMKSSEASFGNTSVNAVDEVVKAEKNLFSASSHAPALFGIDATTGSTLEYSIKNDEGQAYNLYDQFEAWLNRKFGRMFGNRVSVKLLRMTRYSEKQVKDEFLKASQMSAPCKTLYSSAMGVLPSEMMGLTILENEVLNIHEEWKPLNSTHTQTNDESKGRPEKGMDEISDKGLDNRDNDRNKR